MKFAFCLFNYHPFGGMERNFLRICQACLKKGHQIDVFTMKWEGESVPGLKVIFVPCQGWSNHGKAKSYVKNIYKWIQSSSYELVVGFKRMPGLDLYYAADICYAFSVQERYPKGIRFLFQCMPRYRIFADYEAKVFAKDSSTHIMYLVDKEKKRYQSVYGTEESRFHYLPPGIEKEKIREAFQENSRADIYRELSIQENSILLLMVGSDFHRKGVKRSLLAIQALPSSYRSRTHLVIVGKGNSRHLKKYAIKLGIASNIHFVGPRDDVPRFLAASDLLLHPAISENTGNVILESMVAGLPVLASSVCGYSFHIQRANAGKIIPSSPFQQKVMNELLRGMLMNPEQLKKWGRNGWEYADQVDLYSRAEKAVEIMENLARKLSNSSKWKKRF